MNFVKLPFRHLPLNNTIISICTLVHTREPLKSRIFGYFQRKPEIKIEELTTDSEFSWVIETEELMHLYLTILKVDRKDTLVCTIFIQ